MTASPFDEIIERRSTHAYKWLRHDESILPMWVADADFKCPQPILDAIRERTEHGVLGYHLPDVVQPLQAAVIHWLKNQYDWDIDAEWIVWIPGVVSAFNVACKAFCEPGDKVLVQTPNYGPLLRAATLNGLENLTVGTVLENEGQANERWTLDFDELESKAADPLCKLFLFCNPMNPCGSVLTEVELKRIEAICLKHNLLLCSDEIHCDLILEPGLKHTPLASLGEEIALRTITLMAPSKTYNIAGLGCSFAIIKDKKLRQQFMNVRKGIVPDVNLLGYTATMAAYKDGDEWNKKQLDYLRSNRDYLQQEINLIPGLKLLPIEATYLAWIDISGAKLTNPAHFFEQAGVGMSPGRDFGDGNYMRLNFGCPRSTLEEAVHRIKTALLNELPA